LREYNVENNNDKDLVCSCSAVYLWHDIKFNNIHEDLNEQYQGFASNFESSHVMLVLLIEATYELDVKIGLGSMIYT
jgi:hypothetical protein